jgi:phosphoesterase RecJ-like protein
LLAASRRVLITCHRGPDGDATGSMVALAALLRHQGKAATLYCPDLVPRRLRWLPYIRGLTHRLPPGRSYEATLVVDCPDPRLLGDEFPAREVTGPVIALDHHASAVPFGDLFIRDPEAASTGVLVARLARQLGWPIDGDVALGLYVSLAADTGMFRHSNTNAEALRLAADLVEAGVQPATVTERLYERNTLESYTLLSQALASLEVVLAGRVAFMTVTAEMVTGSKARWEDTEGLVNYARAIKGVQCGVLLSPAKRGGVRVSMRSRGSIDAGAVCARLGGGGHRGAAGCTLTGDLAGARLAVEQALRDTLEAPAEEK